MININIYIYIKLEGFNTDNVVVWTLKLLEAKNKLKTVSFSLFYVLIKTIKIKNRLAKAFEIKRLLNVSLSLTKIITRPVDSFPSHDVSFWVINCFRIIKKKITKGCFSFKLIIELKFIQVYWGLWLFNHIFFSIVFLL